MLIRSKHLIPLLSRAEFAHLRFECRMAETIDIDVATILRVRRRLRTAAQEVLRGRTELFKRLFEPQLSADPVALKRYQKGAPAFVIIPSSISYRKYNAGELFIFEVRLFGNIALQAAGLVEAFVALGAEGLRLDAGKYTLERVWASDAGENVTEVWHSSGGAALHHIPRLDLGWWLEGQPQTCFELELKFNTPARLLTRARPMFNPSMEQLFPFVLRRVTAMLYIHCGIEMEPVQLELASEIKGWSCAQNKLYWYDWRQLRSDTGQSTPLGGVCGSLRMQGEVAHPVLSLLQLGSLFNLGKNAAYGAGNYSLVCFDAHAQA